MSPTTTSSESLAYLRELIYRRSAIVLEAGKEYLIESRLAPVARDEGCASLDELVKRLRGNASGPLPYKVIDAMTTNETTFFRDVHPFEALRHHVLPALAKARATARRIDIWCGASSTGQEPFSIAMTIREHFPALASYAVRILATDLSTSVLDRAKTGRFRQLEVNRGLPAAMLVKYFERAGSDWQIRPDILSMVEFRQANLLEALPVRGQVDVVFLRNVLIYFDIATKKAILGRVRSAMAKDAYLFLGGAETTMNLDDRFDRVQVDKSVYYTHHA